MQENEELLWMGYCRSVLILWSLDLNKARLNRKLSIASLKYDPDTFE